MWYGLDTGEDLGSYSGNLLSATPVAFLLCCPVAMSRLGSWLAEVVCD